jgi:hypothetical protein
MGNLFPAFFPKKREHNLPLLPGCKLQYITDRQLITHRQTLGRFDDQITIYILDWTSTYRLQQ